MSKFAKWDFVWFKIIKNDIELHKSGVWVYKLFEEWSPGGMISEFKAQLKSYCYFFLKYFKGAVIQTV